MRERENNGHEAEHEDEEQITEQDLEESGLPAPSSYGPVQQPQSEKLVDTLVGVDPLTEEERKQLWLIRSSNVRHSQFTNIIGDDLPWLRRYFTDIQIVNHWEMPDYSNDLQERLQLDILFRKSRSDLKDGMRERPMWISNIMKYVMEQGAVKAPKDSAGWFGMFKGRERNRY